LESTTSGQWFGFIDDAIAPKAVTPLQQIGCQGASRGYESDSPGESPDCAVDINHLLAIASDGSQVF
jgi:hypothetical protein